MGKSNPSMGKSKEYRQFAAACLEMAEFVANEGSRAVLIDMARVWHRLADVHANETEEESPTKASF